MDSLHNPLMLAAAIFSFAAAALHFACIPWGANGFRILGAGTAIVRLAQTGHWYPPFIAFVIGSILTVWALYALSAAGFIQPLPFLRLTLTTITAIYLARALAFPLLKPVFPGNSSTFWLVSSGVCLIVGLAHLFGLIQVWERI